MTSALAVLILAAIFPDCGGFTTSPVECKDVSPTTTSFTMNYPSQSVSGRMSALAVAADGKRLYAGGFSGVWRSDDAGENWYQLTRPQPSPSLTSVPGSLRVPNVYDVAVSPIDEDLVLAATAEETRTPASSRQGIYRSTDGGASWSMTYQFKCPGAPGWVGQIAFAPDDPSLVYAAGGCAVAKSKNGGASWIGVTLPPGGEAWHLAVAPAEGSSRRVYAAGNGKMLYSDDGGSTWTRDAAIPIPELFAGYPAQGGGSAAPVLAIEPGRPERVYLAVPGSANGPSFFHDGVPGPDGTIFCNAPGGRGCGEGSLWLGDYSGRSGAWSKLSGPAVYAGGGATPSGNVFVQAKATSSGYLLFFSDLTDVHVSQGEPTSAKSWHRVTGRDASAARCASCTVSGGCNQWFMHVDPHALALSPNFDITLTEAFCTVGPAKVPVPAPYDQNSVVDSYLGGMIWMLTDGGVYRSADGGRTWQQGKGLSTLQPQFKFAGLSLPGKGPALYLGLPDNDNMFTLDGGETWRDPRTGCGDCAGWFSDPSMPNRVLEIARGGNWVLFTSSTAGEYPDAADAAQQLNVPLPADAVMADGTGFWTFDKGYRPVVLTPISEDPPADGDYVMIRQTTGGPRRLVRTTQISKIASVADWDTYAEQVGPDFLPAMSTASVVQASGRHVDPFFFVGDATKNGTLWRWTKGASTWQRVVPAVDGSAKVARRFFVDPYNPSRLYLVDEKGIKRSEDAGKTWRLDESLDRLATEKGTYSYEFNDTGGRFGSDLIGSGVLRDMVFDPLERRTRFAVGDAGVFYTVDGENWQRLLSTRAMPGHPVAAYFDRITDPANPMLYVAINGRGIVRLGPIATSSSIKTPCTEGDSPFFPEDPPMLSIPPPPLAIKSFTVKPTLVGQGEPLTFNWSVAGPVRKLTLNGTDVTGKTSHVLSATTPTYSLIAQNKCAEVMTSVKVTVSALTTLDPTPLVPGSMLNVHGENIPSGAKLRLTTAGKNEDFTPLTASSTLLTLAIPANRAKATGIDVRAFTTTLKTNVLKLDISRRNGAFKDVVPLGTADVDCGTRSLKFTTIDTGSKKAIFSDGGGETTIHLGALSGAAFSPGCTTAVMVDRPDASKPNNYVLSLKRFDGVGSTVPPASIRSYELNDFTPATDRFHVLFSPDDSIVIITGYSPVGLNVIAPRDMTRGSFFSTITSTTTFFTTVTAELIDGNKIKLKFGGMEKELTLDDP